MQAGSSVRIRFDSGPPFTVIPGVVVRAGAEFRWKSRVFTAAGRLPALHSQGNMQTGVLQRGNYRCESPFYLVADMMGFFRARAFSGGPADLTVTPQRTGSAPAMRFMSTGGDKISRRIRKTRNDTLIESRQYFPGDDVRRLNWKTYAHTGDLFIRIGEEVPLPESKLLILPEPGRMEDCGMDEKTAGIYLDYLASVASEVISGFTKAGISTEMLSTDGSIISDPEDSDLAGLWWTETPLSISGNRRGSSLLIASAFSKAAAATAETASSSGACFRGDPAAGRRQYRQEAFFFQDTFSGYGQ